MQCSGRVIVPEVDVNLLDPKANEDKIEVDPPTALIVEPMANLAIEPTTKLAVEPEAPTSAVESAKEPTDAPITAK